MSNPAPISSTNETATSPMTNKPRSRFPLLPPPASRPPSFNVSFRFKWEDWRAGARPNPIPVTMATNAVKISTLASMLIVCTCAIVAGMNVFSIRMPPTARSKPNPAPNTASKTLSVRNWRVTRERLAPSASRSAISFCRTAARASSRFATLAQAMRRTNPTAPSKMRSAGLMSPTTSSWSGTTTAPIRVL